MSIEEKYKIYVSADGSLIISSDLVSEAGFEVGSSVRLALVLGKITIERDTPKIAGLFGIGTEIFKDLDWEAERKEDWGD